MKHVTLINCDSDEEVNLGGFHSCDYINILKGDIDSEDDNEEYGLGKNRIQNLRVPATGDSGCGNYLPEPITWFNHSGYDCPPLKDLYEFVSSIARGSVTAARALISGSVDVAVNFCGGWHHAQRDHASGFCYVNDCVLAILELEKKFNRVLYVDLDIHHGEY